MFKMTTNGSNSAKHPRERSDARSNKAVQKQGTFRKCGSENVSSLILEKHCHKNNIKETARVPGLPTDTVYPKK